MRKFDLTSAILPQADLPVTVPAGTEFLHVDQQGERLCAWGVVNTDETETVEILFQIKATGQDLIDIGTFNYLGTVAVAGGSHLWHVWTRE